ncbi:hypothetical protein AC1031_007955 [Aphanomyces cochlioides]|nr:hypothetical protein AC1031_007955 [Aphanomyces cochlioides]
MNTSRTGSPKGDDGLDEEVFWEDGQRYVRDSLGNVYIEEDSPEREVDEKTRKRNTVRQAMNPLKAQTMCECVWFEEVDEEGLKRKIDEILNTLTHSFGITDADLNNYCKGLRMPAQGSVASRLGQFMKQVNDVIDKYTLQQDLKVKGSLKMFLKAVVYRIDPPGLSNLVRFEIKKEPIDSMTAFVKLLYLHMERIEASDRLIQQQEQMEKKKRSPPMGWTNGDVKRRKNSPVKVHFDKPTMHGWGTERGFVGEGS